MGILKLYKNWFLSIIKIFLFICALIFCLIVIIASAPIISSKEVQNMLQNMFDKIRDSL
jgi:hypothetical protein